MDRSPKRQKKSPEEKENEGKYSENDVEKLIQELKHCDPCLKIELSKDDSPEIDLPDGDQNNKPTASLLETMFYPLSSSSFLSSCFRKKAVYIHSENSSRSDAIAHKYMFDLDAKQIFHETSSDSVFLWIPVKDENEHEDDQNKLTTSSAKPLKSIEIADPETASTLHDSGYASYCRAPPELEQPLVYNMLKDTGLGCGQYDPSGEKLTTLGRGEVEVFYGTKGHVTDWHTDFQENFTLQLSGQKKWTLKQGAVKHPIRGTTPHYQSTKDVIENQLKASRLSNPNFQFGKQDVESNAYGNETEVILGAGDVLYFPAGMWHKVETLQRGVSINISLMGVNYSSLISQALQQVLLKRSEWREVVCCEKHLTKDAPDPDSAVQKIETLLKDLPAIIDDFRKKGGALGILPPVLRHPPSFEISSMSNLESDDHNDDEKSNEDISGDEEEENLSDGSPQESELENNDDIINVHNFVPPEDWGSNASKPSEKHHLMKNPLAHLMKMSAVSTTKKEDEDSDLFILNVSFAGNEMLESAVRVVFLDNSGILLSLAKSEENGESEKSIASLVSEDSPVLPVLLFYGYLSWVMISK